MGAISILCLIVMLVISAFSNFLFEYNFSDKRSLFSFFFSLVISGLFTFGLIVTLLIGLSSVFCLNVTLVISALYVRLIVTFVISALYFLFDCYVSDKCTPFSF